MSNTKLKIEKDLKQALLSRNTTKVEVLRFIKSSILNEEISKMKRESGLSEDEVVTCLRREAKKRKEAAEMYRENSAEAMAEKEEKELEIIETYLPEAIPEEDLLKIINETIKDNGGEVTPKNFGVIIGQVRTKAGSGADGGYIAGLVKQRMGHK